MKKTAFPVVCASRGRWGGWNKRNKQKNFKEVEPRTVLNAPLAARIKEKFLLPEYPPKKCKLKEDRDD